MVAAADRAGAVITRLDCVVGRHVGRPVYLHGVLTDTLGADVLRACLGDQLEHLVGLFSDGRV